MFLVNIHGCVCLALYSYVFYLYLCTAAVGMKRIVEGIRQKKHWNWEVLERRGRPQNTCEELTRMPRTAICVYKMICVSLFVSVALALTLIHCSFFTYAPFVPRKIQAWQLRTLGPFGWNICSAIAAFYKCADERI